MCEILLTDIYLLGYIADELYVGKTGLVTGNEF